MIRLDIFGDPVCPWCLIGKAHLDAAIAASGRQPFAIAWHPFQLNPDLPREGAPLMAFLAARFGGEERARALCRRVEGFAAEAGLDLDLEAVPRATNTADAHRLIHWAGIEGAQEPIVAALLRAYWFDRQDIADHLTLAGIAGAAGMDRAVVLRLLASDADRDTLAAAEAHARGRGIAAVPTFIVADRHVVSGAQPRALWTQVIDETGG